MIKVTTWNINSVRIRLDLIKKFIDKTNPDILCLQETKVINDLFPHDFFIEHGFKWRIINGEPGYNGVAILSKIELLELENHLNHSRHIACRVRNEMELHNFYIHAGGDVADVNVNIKFKQKLDFLDNITSWFKKFRTSDSKLLLLGDLNIAPLENDVWSHKQLLKVVSHTPIEIEKLKLLYESVKFSDAIRKFVPEDQKLYSWWSYRNKDWLKSNRGRRLDHIWITKKFESLILNSYIGSDFRNHPSPSDHVPVTVEIEF